MSTVANFETFWTCVCQLVEDDALAPLKEEVKRIWLVTGLDAGFEAFWTPMNRLLPDDALKPIKGDVKRIWLGAQSSPVVQEPSLTGQTILMLSYVGERHEDRNIISCFTADQMKSHLLPLLEDDLIQYCIHILIPNSALKSEGDYVFYGEDTMATMEKISRRMK
jgi:hypothetical protein